MQLIVESTRDGRSVVWTERRTKIIGCRGVKCRKKANAQQSSLHRGRSISVERVNVVNVERIFVWYRKLEIKRLQAE
jgi:ABC-type enterochelin transport system substrate-binding protein